jgi:hypothetical protein
MKITLTIAALLVMVPMVSSANKDFPPVYNLTGTVKVWLASPHDYNSTVTVDGHTYFSGCNVSGNDVKCDDNAGGFTVTLTDGHTYVLSAVPSVFRFGKYGGEDWMNIAPDMLSAQVIANGMSPITFQYRFVTMTGKSNLTAGSYFCIPSATPVKHRLYEEVCYTMIGLLH